MILTSYEQIVRHLSKFSDKKLFLYCMDDSIHEVVNVESGTKGLSVTTKEKGKILLSHSHRVFNNLTEKEFYPNVSNKKRRSKQKHPHN